MFGGAIFATDLPSWRPHLDVWIVLSAAFVGYLVLITRWAPVTGPERLSAVWSRRQQLACLAAFGLLWLGADWPIHDVAEERMYSVHMLQHLLFTQLAAPLLLLGTPGWFIVRFARRWSILPFLKGMNRFFPALLLHSTMVAVSHIPWWVETSLSNAWFHAFAHFWLFTAALLVWLPIASRASALPRLDPLPRIALIFLLGVMPTLPATWLAYAENPVYEGYAIRPKLWGWTAMDDQQMAALVMKTAAGAIGFLLIAVIFFRWAGGEERRSRTAKGLAWQDR